MRPALKVITVFPGTNTENLRLDEPALMMRITPSIVGVFQDDCVVEITIKTMRQIGIIVKITPSRSPCCVHNARKAGPIGGL
jgi:hypothetical protein